MSEERIRLKDLADELNVQHKDMLRAVRELNMPAKNISGSVNTAESERLRQYFKKNKESDKTEENKPNVIVRKRRNENKQASPEVADKVKTEHKDSKEHREHKRNDNKRETRDASVPSSAKTDKPSEQGEVKQGEARRKRNERSNADRAARRKLRSLLETKARVISKPAPKVPPPPPPVAEPPAQEVVAKPQPEPVVPEQVPVQPVVAIEKAEKTEKTAEKIEKAEKVEKKAEKLDKTPEKSTATTARIIRTPNKPAEPRVRIISRPDKPATPKPTSGNKERPPRGNRDNRDDNKENRRSREQRNARPRQGGGKFGDKADKFAGYRQQADSMPLPDSKDGQNKRKRLKGRRTPDFQRGDFGAMEEENVPRMNRNRVRRKPAKRNAPHAPTVVTQPLKAAKRKLRIAEFITVADMAKQMGLKANELIKTLFGMGVMATINQSLDIDTATLLASEFSYEVEKTGFSEDDYLLPKESDTPESLQTRPPVVTIMGHVDHGKTSLLDAIRKTHVTSGEAGGITQHIGAYHVKTKRGDIVFLDTPGHEAFTAMRARGAQITDLVILVVAADDGVMEQTKEAISHSRAANVPIMVAVNKMDKPGADPDRVLRELAELGLQAEDWGGDTIVAKVSAKTRQGLDELLEMVALQSEIMELKANPNKTARGHIVEARLDKGRGAVATVLIQEGTLHHGDNFVCGQFSGRVRSLLNDQGKKVKEAGPSMPVEVQGFDGVPEAGEEFIVVADEKVARRIADSRATKQRERTLASESRVTLETFLAQHAGEQEVATLNLVLKADVQGSLEAVTEAVNKLSTDKVRVHVVHGGTGAISESDILLASASGAIVIGFNVKPTAKMREVAEHENIDIRFYDIIYKLVEDIKSAMAGLLAPVQKEVYLGQAEVRETFTLQKVGTIAGCYVSDGKMQRNAGIRLLRDGVVVYTGKVASLKRFKDDAREVVKGNECGVCLENFNDIKIGDILEAFETVEEAAKL